MATQIMQLSTMMIMISNMEGQVQKREANITLMGEMVEVEEYQRED